MHHTFSLSKPCPHASMLAMLSRHSTPRRSCLSLQLLRHFSIRVSSLKKQSLFAQLLRGNGSPKFTQFTQKGGTNGPQGEASLRSVSQPPPPVLENGRQQEQRLVADDACIAKLSVRSKKESKEVQHRDGPTKLSARSLGKGSKAHHSDGDTLLPKLSVPNLREGSNVGDTQPSVRAQTGSKRGRYSDSKIFQKESTKVEPAKISVQSQIAREEGHRSHGPVDSKPDGKRLALQSRKASQEPCLPFSEFIRITSASALVLSKEICSVAGKCITANASTAERGEENAIKRTRSLNKSVRSVGRETSKQLKVKHFADKFLHDLQRKIELLDAESAPLTHVKALLTKRAFLSKSPEKLAEVLTVLKRFFESGDKACQILVINTRIIAQPLQQLRQRLQVLVEFEVDKATCYRLGTRPYTMGLKVEKYRSVLSFLKELGLSVEARNRIICKYPLIMRGSVENRMQPNVNFFESMEVARPSLLKLVESCPRTICLSIDKNFVVMHKLFQHVGLSDKALRNMSQYSNRHFCSRYKFFREQGLSDEAFDNMIKRHPSILTMSEEDLKAKLHFLLHTAKWDISEILVFPAYFKYSLANRIIPRIKLLQELNLPRRPYLSTLLTVSKTDLMAKLNISYSSKCI